ncbi:MAG: beta-propeller fold lactonase family protein [Thermoplasmata archaeon]
MKQPRTLWLVPAAAVLLLLVSASASAQAPTSPPLASPGGAGGAVFTMSNAVAGNQVLAYEIGPGGALIPVGHFRTHGTGTGVSLADQGALALTSDHRYLLVVNAGDNTVTVFAVHTPSASQPILSFVDRVASRGVAPVSLTVHDDFVYVLNAGNATVGGGIAGFLLADHGLLLPLPGSREPLSTSAPTGPAEVAFNPAGTVLVVTEEDTNLIDTYVVSERGIAEAPLVSMSNGSTPYGFAFSHHGALIVSDAASGALSSYAVSSAGQLTVVSGSVPDGQAAPCWVAVAGSYAFTSNAHGATITSYHIGAGGSLSVAVDVAATTGAADTDLAVGGSHGQYLLVWDAGAAELQEFRIGSGGTLTPLYAVFSLPATGEGLAAF